MFTEEQRAWVKGFIAKPPAPDAAGDADGDAQPVSDQGPPAGNGRPPPLGVKEGAGGTTVRKGLLGLPIPVPDLDDVTAIKSTCSLDNKTAVRLLLVSGSTHMQHGKLTTNPAPAIEPGGHSDWVVENTKAPSWVPFLGGLSLSGCEGKIQYAFPDGKTIVSCHFKATFSGNLPAVGSGNNVCEISLDGPDKAKYEAFATGGDGSDGHYNFQVKGQGTPPNPNPNPNPNPTPGPNETPAATKTSCLITVTNSTAAPIKLAHQSNDSGDFMTNPPTTIAPGGSAQFAFVQTPGGKDPSCHGAATFEAGSPAATWRVEWTNPVGQKNTATATLDPQTAGYASLEQAGQGDENVPFTFTLSGGGAKPIDPPTPVPPTPVPPLPVPPVPVPPPPTEEPAFRPPPSGKEPTLRKDDKSPDGWVEYLQQALNKKANAKLAVDGDFGATTLKAVLAYQKANHLQVDGTVGNQTWASLRDNTPEAPSTDGRKPHTFEQHGVQARFFTEKDPVKWDASTDTLILTIVSVGDTAIEGRTATLRITPPGTKPHTLDVKLPKGTPASSTDQGAIHLARVEKFTTTYPSTPPGAPGSGYTVEAYLEEALGGDHWAGRPT